MGGTCLDVCNFRRFARQKQRSSDSSLGQLWASFGAGRGRAVACWATAGSLHGRAPVPTPHDTPTLMTLQPVRYSCQHSAKHCVNQPLTPSVSTATSTV